MDSRRNRSTAQLRLTASHARGLAEKLRVKRRGEGFCASSKERISLDWPWPRMSTGRQSGVFPATRSRSESFSGHFEKANRDLGEETRVRWG